MTDPNPMVVPAAIASQAFQVAPRLYAGAYPGAPDPRLHEAKGCALLELGVTHVVTLMEPDETDREGRPFRPYAPALEAAGVSVERFAIRDVSTPSVETVVAVLDAIDDALDAGRTVYVHCWGGRGRTAVIAGCWLVRHGLSGGLDAVDALWRLRAACGCSNEDVPNTGSQARLIRSWRRDQ